MLRKTGLLLLFFFMGIICLLSYIFLYMPSHYQKPINVQNYIKPSYPKLEQHKKNPVVARGEILVKAGNCLSCHTSNGGEAFAGGRWIGTPYGALPSTNITFDDETGIGKWRVDEFKQAMTKGISPDNKHYFPVFPYPYFAQLKEVDLHAIYAYLKAVPKVYKPNLKPTFPYNLWGARWSMKLWNYFALPLAFPKQNLPGKIYVDSLGHCGVCHTPTNFFGMPKQRYYLGGQFVAGYYAPNISKNGLQFVSTTHLYESLMKGKKLFGATDYVGPMSEVYEDSFATLPKNILKDIAIYLKTVDSKPAMSVNLSGFNIDQHYSRGKAIYHQVCSNCHTTGRMGATLLGNKVRWRYRLNTQGLDLLYRRTINGYNKMPKRGGCTNCSKEDIKDAVDYLLSRSVNIKKWQAYR